MPQSALTPPTTRAQSASIALPIAVLVLCCLFWGFSFPAMQITAGIFEKSLDDASLSIPGTRGQLASRSVFNAWRFAIATAALFLLTFRRYRHFSRADIVGGLIVGLTF